MAEPAGAEAQGLMATLAIAPARARWKGAERAEVFAGVAAVAAVAGSAALLPLWRDAWRLWTSDALRSIGMMFPVLALAGVLRAWRSMGWRAEGTWWGLVPVLVSIGLARVTSLARVAWMWHGHRINLLHPGPELALYGVGMVLVVGGRGLLRKAWPALLLLAVIDPVPHWFNGVVDLPLQRVGAEMARNFARGMGVGVTGDELRMMFAPEFGMVIVPGCNGLRGAVTLMWLTAIFGYVRGVRPGWLAGLSGVALMGGYVLNFVRLALLVVYYRVGLEWTWIQRFGEGVDYAIGGGLFLLAAAVAGVVVRRFGRPRERHFSHENVVRAEVGAWWRVVVCGGLAAGLGAVQLRAADFRGEREVGEAEVLAALPAEVGAFRLERSWAEHDANGRPAMAMGEYAAGGERMRLGLWVGSGNHLVAQSRLAQGLRPVWAGGFAGRSADAVPLRLAVSEFRDGVTETLEAEAACSAAGCGDEMRAPVGDGLIFLGPGMKDLAVPAAERRLPILLERERTAGSAGDVRDGFEAEAGSFLAGLRLRPLVERLGSRP